MKRSIPVMFGALTLFLAVGCAQAPQDLITTTQAELDKAETQAPTWAPTELNAAREAMTAAQAEIKTQNEKWIKNYDKATELLNAAKESATKAAEAAVADKAQARKDAEAAIAEADAAVQGTAITLKAAPVTKDSKADLNLFKTDLATLGTTLEGARQSFGSEDYKKALESAGSVKNQASSIAAQLEAAKHKVAARKQAKKSSHVHVAGRAPGR